MITQQKTFGVEMKKQAALKQILFFIIFATGLILWGFYSAQHQKEDLKIVGQMAPKFQAENFKGKKVSFDNIIGKKVVLINFWATWCAPCQEEVPVLNSIYRALDPSKFELVALMEDDEASMKEYKAVLKKFKKKVAVDFTVYIDRYGLAADLFGTRKIPESYLIDLNGKVVKKYTGAISFAEQKELVELVRNLAKSPKQQ